MEITKDELNRAFGTSITEEKYIDELFDIYDSEEEFEENVGECFAECQFYDTAEEVCGKYVFFNEVNYDWETGKSTLFGNEK